MFTKRRKPESRPVKEATKEVKSIIKEVPEENEDIRTVRDLLKTSLDPYSPISIAIPFKPDDILIRNIDFALAGSHIDDESFEQFKEVIEKDHNFAYQFANDRLKVFVDMITDYLMDVMLNSCMNMAMPINLILDENNNSLLNHIDFLSYARSEMNRLTIRKFINDSLRVIDISYPEEFPGIVMDIDLQTTEISMITDNLLMNLHRLLFTTINDAINDFVFGGNNINTVNFVAEYIKNNNVYTKSLGIDKDDDVTLVYSQSLVKKWLFDTFFKFPMMGFEKWLLEDFRDQFILFMVKCGECSFYQSYLDNLEVQDRKESLYKYK